MQDHERPSIAQLSARLAANNARVIDFLENLTSRVDTLVEAATADDWQEVERISDHVARSSAAYGYAMISESAQRLCEAVQADDMTMMRRRLVKLIGVCGRARRPDAAASHESE
ncbi:MAG: hypothetical protein RIC55_20050 [Pirellulaceae bacterium]